MDNDFGLKVVDAEAVTTINWNENKGYNTGYIDGVTAVLTRLVELDYMSKADAALLGIDILVPRD